MTIWSDADIPNSLLELREQPLATDLLPLLIEDDSFKMAGASDPADHH